MKVLLVDKLIIVESLGIIENFNLKPRDAIHAAVMKINKIKEIVSEDADFDKVEGIIRYDIKSFLEKFSKTKK